jgi:cyclic dehypoxanthinyl futalosine synthase
LRMSLTKQQALEMFQSDDLIGIGMEADAVRRRLHPEGVATYIIDRNINYTNFCTEYCTFCAFYRPLKGPAAKEGYILDFDTIYEKIRETVEMGGTGVLMQGGLHPDLKIDWHERMLRGIKERFPKIHLHCYSASEILAIAEYSALSVRDTIARLRDHDVRRRRNLRAPRESFRRDLPPAGRNGRVHGIHSVEFPAGEYGARRTALG